MENTVLIIGNSNHTLMYSASLRGYGYALTEMRAFDAALDWLATDQQPDCIIIDMRGQAAATCDFVGQVREAGLTTRIIVIGTTSQLNGVDITLPATLEATDLIDVLRYELKIA